MKFLAALAPLLLSVAGRILTALGITAVTYVGFDLMVGQFKNHIQTQVGGMSADWLNLFYLVGGGVVLNILFGAMTFVVSFKSMSKLATSLGRKK
ncbi:MAG: DUF2523 domain-containing protein [Eikenella sp.]|nr:DUF2523 domain-containing protein [Eikenella sp.]